MIDNDAMTTGRARYQIDPYTSVRDLLVSIDAEVQSATAPEAVLLPFGNDTARFWWPSQGQVTVYVTGLVDGKDGIFQEIRRRYVTFRIRRHFERKSPDGYVVLPVLTVTLETTTIEPAKGESLTCDAVVITLDRSRIAEMQPLPGTN